MKNKGQRLLIFIVLLVVLVFTIILIKNKKEAREKIYIPDRNAAVVVTVGKVEKKNMILKQSYTATLFAKQEAFLSCPISGIVKETYFDDGDFVQKGQQLAQLDMDAVLVEYDAALSKQQSDSAEYFRYLKASQMSSGSVSMQQLAQLKTKWVASVSNTKRLAVQLRYARLEAPFSGYINGKNIQVGSLIGPALIYAKLTSMTWLEGRFYVSEHDVALLKKGQKVEVRNQEMHFEAPMIYVANRANDEHKYEVHLEINNQNNKFKAGQYVEVEIRQEKALSQEVVVIRREAILGSLKNAKIYKVVDSVARVVPVQVHASTDEEVAVSSPSIVAGDMVVTAGQINLIDGAKVRFK